MMHDAIYQEKLQRRNLALVLRHNLLEADHKNREDRKKVEDAAAIADNQYDAQDSNRAVIDEVEIVIVDLSSEEEHEDENEDEKDVDYDIDYRDDAQ